MFSFLVTSCVTLVAAQQQLELAQHIALMDLYGAVGSNRQTKRNRNPNIQKNFFALQVVLLNRARASRRLHRALALAVV
jgi:hypothetical protein